jgi:hypothetical protein
LDITFEHLGEGSLDESAEAPFEGLEDSHEASFLAPERRSYRARSAGSCVLA